MGIEGLVTQLTVNEINDLIIQRVFWLVVFLFLSGVGYGLGIKARKEAKRIIGIIVGIISTVGSISYFFLLLDALKLLGQVR